MSFSFNFIAAPADVPLLLESNSSAKNAPACVKDFIVKAATGIKSDFVSVKANGHLFEGASSEYSTANIEVVPLVVTKP